jgi:hypothetical protein
MEHAWYKFSRIFFGFVGVFQDSKLLKTIFKKHMDRHTPCNLGFLKSTFWWGQGAEVGGQIEPHIHHFSGPCIMLTPGEELDYRHLSA